MPAAVDHILSSIEKNVKPYQGRTKEGSAIAIAKSRGLIRQKGRHLALGYKGK